MVAFFPFRPLTFFTMVYYNPVQQLAAEKVIISLQWHCNHEQEKNNKENK